MPGGKITMRLRVKPEARERRGRLTQRGYTAQIGMLERKPYVYPNTGPAGTHTVNGVTYWAVQAQARDVAAGFPRSRVEKRPKGWVIVKANGRPHDATMLRPFKGDTWAMEEARRRKLRQMGREDALNDLVALEAVRLLEAKDSLLKASTPKPFSTSKTSNWVARAGGLPAYVQHVAHALHEKRGMTVSHAIAAAINTIKRWSRGGGGVDANTQAAAIKALSEWEAMKAKAKAS
jgi:hypothetical protein